METLSVAIALPSGELDTAVIDFVDNHPLLDLCGVARSAPDLIRLLDRFHPEALLMDPSLLEDLEQCDPASEDVLKSSVSVSFLLSNPGMSWDEEKVACILRLPLRYGGIIRGDQLDRGDFFREIRRKVELFGQGGNPGCARSGGGDADGVRLVSVLGCKGGVGGTLVSSSLAAAIALSGRRVLLMETDGMLSQLLHLKPRDTGKVLLDLLPLAEEISWDLIRVSLYRHAAGFHLLPFGRLPAGKPAPETAASGQLLRNLLFLFDLVVLDVPVSSRSELSFLLHHRPAVLLVSLPDTLAASCARVAAGYLQSSGLTHERLHLAVNRCGSHHALNPDELARAVGIELLAALPEDQRSGLDFAELGELPHPESPFARAVAGMAAALGFGDIPSGKSSSPRRLKRMRGRAGRGTS